MKVLTPYEIGRRAYAAGAALESNPYSASKQMRAWVQWSFGWTDAEEETAQSEAA